MRPLPQLLTPLVGAGCVLALAAAPASAADAEATPRLVEAGRAVTVMVSCDPVDGSVPGSIEGVSSAFAGGNVRLKRVTPEEEDPSGGPAYRGRAKVSEKAEFDDSRQHTRTSEWDVEGLCPGGEQWAASYRIDESAAADDGAGRDARADRGERSAGGGSAADAPSERSAPGAVASASDGEQVSTAALAGGSAALCAAIAAGVLWHRRAGSNR